VIEEKKKKNLGRRGEGKKLAEKGDQQLLPDAPRFIEVEPFITSKVSTTTQGSFVREQLRSGGTHCRRWGKLPQRSKQNIRQQRPCSAKDLKRCGRGKECRISWKREKRKNRGNKKEATQSAKTLNI